MMTITWEEYAVYLANDEGDLDMDEKCFYCPDCGEPVYRDDYPVLDLETSENEALPGVVCPICGFVDWGC